MIFNYLTTNKVNQKRYVGSHDGDFTDGYLGSGKLLLKAIKRYGRENFTRDVLNVVSTREEAFNNEKFLIEMYKTLASEGNYNLSPTGGTECSGRHSEKSKRTMSDNAPTKAVLQYSLKGDLIKKWKSARVVWRTLGFSNTFISSCARRKIFSAYGYIWRFQGATEGIEVITQGVKKLVKERVIRGHSNGKPILQYSLDGNFIKKWRSASDAQRELKLNSTSISNCAQKKVHTAHGFVWRFKDEVKNTKDVGEEIGRRVKERESAEHYSNKVVLQYSLKGEYIKEYMSVTSACGTTGISAKNISHCACNDRLTAGGYIWEFKNGRKNEDIHIEIKKCVKRGEYLRHSKKQPVLQYSLKGELLKTWDSATDIEGVLGFKKGGIGRCAFKKRAFSYGFVWRFIKDGSSILEINNEVKEFIKKENSKSHPKSKSIIQRTLGGEFVKEWEGASAVHRELGFSQGNISSCARGGRPTADGFVWQFKENIKK